MGGLQVASDTAGAAVGAAPGVAAGTAAAVQNLTSTVVLGAAQVGSCQAGAGTVPARLQRC